MHRHTARHLLMILLSLAGCRPALDEPKPRLGVPASLPAFSTDRPPVAASQHAADLARQGVAWLDKADLARAIPLLTEALAADPASPFARLQLARAFAQGGRASVALALLQPAKIHQHDCGTCVELLQAVRVGPDFKHLRETSEGRDLLDGVREAPLPYASWAQAIVKALVRTDLALLAGFIDARQPFELVRSCPTCSNVASRPESRRSLLGMGLAAKVAVRFDTTHAEARGLPLLVPGAPSCAAPCCTWTLPKPVPANQVALRRLCFWPRSPALGVLTEIALEYGDTATTPMAP